MICEMVTRVKEFNEKSDFEQSQKNSITFYADTFLKLFKSLESRNEATENVVKSYKRSLEEIWSEYEKGYPSYDTILDAFNALFTREYEDYSDMWKTETAIERDVRQLIIVDKQIENIPHPIKGREEMLLAKNMVASKNIVQVKVYDRPICIEDTYIGQDYGVESFDSLNSNEYFDGECIQFIYDETLMRNSKSLSYPLTCLRIYLK